MKKQKFVLLLAILCSIPTLILSQGGLFGNLSSGTNYLGFAGGIIQPLNIRNDFNQPIQFFTNSAANERVRIFNNTLSPSTLKVVGSPSQASAHRL